MKAIEEKKAEKKWCPHVRHALLVTPGVYVSVNRKDDNPNPSWARCITRECIYWERKERDPVMSDWLGHCTHGGG